MRIPTVLCWGLLVGVAALMPSFAEASIILKTAVNLATGHTYHLLEPMSWTDSEAEAVKLGGHLVTINDANEDKWVFDTFTENGNVERDLWIGLYDPDGEESRGFEWVSPNEPIDYAETRFIPSPDGDDEFYVHIISPGFANPGTWNDFSNGGFFSRIPYGVVEVTTSAVPEPATLAIWGLGMAGFAAMGWRKRRKSA